MGKTVSLKKLLTELSEAKKKVVFTNGCFDILHAGHARYLKKARSLGDILVVGLNSDSSIRKIKGPGRPIVPEKDRAELLSALGAVDYVVIFSGKTPIKLIKAILPDVLVKGADWKNGQIVGEDVVKDRGGKVARIPLAKGRSTTDVIKKIIELNGNSK
ncbi:ADP-heptose synthase / D-glycero-beta-D-manno-heptose 7-phosphate kinase [hydrothermal vent metagenome]|uniref:D-glycero-beta-D-manno-heptose 1-phosphate adenylyltransferase n=1 Tax=hydrothermal vent metagenome TaxID=652676 RepID=A0A3B0RKZ2_9ZZZZ